MEEQNACDGTLHHFSQNTSFFGEKQIGDVSKDVVKDWIVWAGGFWSAKTVNNARGVLNIILEAAVDKETAQKAR